MLALAVLCPSDQSQASGRTPKQAYQASDLIQGEYQQNLALAKQEGEQFMAKSPPEDLGWAALYSARVARLRGEYSQAQRHYTMASVQRAELNAKKSAYRWAGYVVLGWE